MSASAWRYVRLVSVPTDCLCWRGCDTCPQGTAAVAVYAGLIRIMTLCEVCATRHRASHTTQLELF
jgi:hypothetical protein